jgi:MFS family permease
MKHSWVRITVAMFAVGWGANQFSPMLIVYRHELGLRAGAIAGLFVVYAITLIPGLLAGGPASDRFGRRAVLLPMVIVSPLATLLLVVGSHSLPLIVAGRALAGLCSGVVFSSATAWVQDLSGGSGASARRSALALTAGFGLGPFTAAVLAQWAPDPAVVPYIPHLVIGALAAIVVWPVPDAGRSDAGRRRGLPAGLRDGSFWLAIAPSAPFVFGTISIAIVVLPEEVTSARTLSAGFTAVMIAFAFCAGAGIQRLARRMETRLPFSGNVAGQCCATVGALIAIPAVAGPSEPLAVLAAAFLGLSYGLNLVAGLQRSERLADERDRGAIVACYYALAYIGFGAPYLMDALNLAAGRTGAFVIFACVAGLLAAWTAVYTRTIAPAAATPVEGHDAQRAPTSDRSGS